MIGFFKNTFFSKKKEKSNIEEEKPIYVQHSIKEETFRDNINFFDRNIDKMYEKDMDIDQLKYQIQIINSKLDAIMAKLDNLIMKISYLENLINSLFYRR